MKNLFRNFFWSLPPGPKGFLLAYLLLFPISLAGHYTHTFELRGLLALNSAMIWKGQVWRLVTYAFLPAGVGDWIISSFWLATLISVMRHNWSSSGFLGYCLLGASTGALPIVLLKPDMPAYITSNAAVLFALLAAWDWFHQNERLLLLGVGEISVRQAVLLILFINAIVLMFCCGWFVTVAMACGGLAGRLWLWLHSRLFLGRTSRQIQSERMARLEL